MPQYRDAQGNMVDKVPTQEEYMANRAKQLSPTNSAITCDECGGSHFFLAHAEQWGGGGYGSMEFKSLTASPYPVRVCLCGSVLPPQQSYQPGARQVQTARDQFFQSVAKARDRRMAMAADKLADKIAKAAASREELEAVRKSLDARITALEKVEQSDPNEVIVPAAPVPIPAPAPAPAQSRAKKAKKSHEGSGTAS